MWFNLVFRKSLFLYTTDYQGTPQRCLWLVESGGWSMEEVVKTGVTIEIRKGCRIWKYFQSSRMFNRILTDRLVICFFLLIDKCKSTPHLAIVALMRKVPVSGFYYKYFNNSTAKQNMDIFKTDLLCMDSSIRYIFSFAFWVFDCTPSVQCIVLFSILLTSLTKHSNNHKIVWFHWTD